MFRSAFVAFFRSFTRHPLYGLLNLLGLSFGVAVFITLGLLYRFETSYESWSPARPNIHAVGGRFTLPGMPQDLRLQTMGGLLEDMQAAWPQLEGTRDYSSWFIVHHGGQVTAEHMEFVDPNFLTFFAVPTLRGNPAGALADPSHVVVSATIARKYFGTIDAVGRSLTLGGEDGLKIYTVSAVIADLPKNSDMRLDMLVQMTPQLKAKFGPGWRQWGVTLLTTYVKFKNPADARALAAQLPAFTDRQAGNAFGSGVVPHKAFVLSLVALADRHLIDPKQKAAVTALGLVGLLALGLGLINYINLATARAGLRAREVAVRKTLGASPMALRLQFLIEAFFTLLLAFAVALCTVELTLPLINAMGGLSLQLYRGDVRWLLALLGCVLLSGLVAALYPGFVLSAFKPAQVLASSRTPGGGRTNGWLRTALAMVQFTAVVVGFILMAGFILQIRHIQTADLGFRRDNLLIIGGMANPAVTPDQRRAFIAAARILPAVRAASYANAVPGPAMSENSGELLRPGQGGRAPAPLTVNVELVGPDYFHTLDARLLAGRVFDSQHGEDRMWSGPDEAKGRMLNVVISRRAAREMGFASPQAAIGETANFLDGHVRIVGVVEDVRFKSPYAAIPAKLYLLDTEAFYEAGLVRYHGVSEADMRRALAGLWRQVNSAVPLDADSAAGNLDTYYKPERDRSHLFTLGTGIAALIGCIGLYGMAAFNTSRRVHEIGMRKVLGASRGQVIRLLLVQLLKPVLLASVVAWPLAWIILQRWLARFDDAITIPLWLFPGATVAALLLALVSVTGVAFAAANAEPGKALRHE